MIFLSFTRKNHLRLIKISYHLVIKRFGGTDKLVKGGSKLLKGAGANASSATHPETQPQEPSLKHVSEVSPIPHPHPTLFHKPPQGLPHPPSLSSPATGSSTPPKFQHHDIVTLRGTHAQRILDLSPPSPVSTPLLPGNLKSSSHPTSQSPGVTVTKRGYASYSVNDGEKTPIDSQALKNNPVIQTKKGKIIKHKEVHRQICDQPGCTGKFCIGLCGIPVKRKAIAHGTHGQPPSTETGKTTVQVSQTDFNGQNKPQNFVFYDKAHDTNPTPEDIQGTQKINSDPSIQQTIKQYEDKT